MRDLTVLTAIDGRDDENVPFYTKEPTERKPRKDVLFLQDDRVNEKEREGIRSISRQPV